MKRNVQKGFTLIELLTVIAIIGILATIVIVSTTSSRYKAKFSRAVADMKNIATAAEQQYYKNTPTPAYVNSTNYQTKLVPIYLASWPTPPCSGWEYKVENTLSGASGYVRVALRITATSNTVFYYCIKPDSTLGTCGTSGESIQTTNKNYLTCEETGS